LSFKGFVSCIYFSLLLCWPFIFFQTFSQKKDIRQRFLDALQKYGFLREEALALTKVPYLGFIDFSGSTFSIKKAIIKTAPKDLRNSIARVMINYPEVFAE